MVVNWVVEVIQDGRIVYTQRECVQQHSRVLINGLQMDDGRVKSGHLQSNVVEVCSIEIELIVLIIGHKANLIYLLLVHLLASLYEVKH